MIKIVRSLSDAEKQALAPLLEEYQAGLKEIERVKKYMSVALNMVEPAFAKGLYGFEIANLSFTQNVPDDAPQEERKLELVPDVPPTP